MYHTEAYVIIDQPMAAVFATVSDIGRLKEWQDGLIEAKWTSKEPHGSGSTYIFVSQFVGTRWEIPGQITMWDRPNGWQWKANGGPFPVQGGYQLMSVAGGTRIRMFSDSEPTGWMNLMRPFLKWMGERTYKRSLTRLKAILEA